MVTTRWFVFRATPSQCQPKNIKGCCQCEVKKYEIWAGSVEHQDAYFVDNKRCKAELGEKDYV
ncbi:MAG: hypothetical protein C6W54_17700 [Bacillaceae bacterium]|nr:MAG: hypothetical protein C6W54_17700 [Bacillaceae bacterium]